MMSWRRCLRASLLLALSAVPTAVAADKAKEASCDLSAWVSAKATPGEVGYHVLCVLSSTEAEVYRLGVTPKKKRDLKVLQFSAESFRQRMADLLKIKTTLQYKPAGMKPVKWPKQPWTVFTEDGEELQPDTEVSRFPALLEQKGGPVVLLLFEGGAWRWPSISVGFTREVMPGITLRTISRQPGLFAVNFDDELTKASLNKDLLAHVVVQSDHRMRPSEMEGHVDKTVRSSDQVFLSYATDAKLKLLSAGTAKLLRGYEANLEHLQVLRYQKNQHYDAHRDYWDPREFPDIPRFSNQRGEWHQRHATLLWYLSGPEEGGETWFPRAHGGDIPWDNWMACDQRGEKVSPNNATAVLFYSLQADGGIDEFSWHCGCPVKKGVKYAANSWMRNSPMQGKVWPERSEL